MEDNCWSDEKQMQLDLSLENSSLETEIFLKTGAVFQQQQEVIDPVIHNQFLKNVLAFEEADNEPQIPMKSLFPENFEFSPVDSMSDEQIEQKLDDIYDILSAHTIEFGFAEALPHRILYKYLVEECIPNDTVHASAAIGFTMVLDGCSGYCPDCFQREYCKVAVDYENCDDNDR